MKHAIDPEGRRLPIKLDTTSNGEFAPVPLASGDVSTWASSPTTGVSPSTVPGSVAIT